METRQFLQKQNAESLTTTGVSYAAINETNDIEVEELAIFFITNQYFGCIKYEESYSLNAFMNNGSTSEFLYIKTGSKKEMLKMMNQFMLQEAIHQYNPESEVFELPMVVTDYDAFPRQINESIQTTNLVKVINLL